MSSNTIPDRTQHGSLPLAAPRTDRTSLPSWLIRGRSALASHLLLLPAAFWLVLFLILPVAFLLALSVAKRGPYGTVLWAFTWENFARALDPKYLPVLLRTVEYAGATTALCLALGFPLAYYLSFYAGKKRETLLVMLMIPFWTSCLVAIYSWMIILGRHGLINDSLTALGLIHDPLPLLNNGFSVVLGLVYFYIPFMVLPLYGSLEKIPRAYIEASYDLGANPARTLLKVTIPLCLPGIFSGCLLTFIPCMGDFLTAEFMGGPRNFLVGNLIENQFLMSQDWPFGAALTALLVFSLISGLYFYQKLEARQIEP